MDQPSSLLRNSTYPDVTALILAGGASTRMGVDKAFLTYEGTPLITRVHDVLAPLFADVLIAAGTETPGRGPFPARALYDAMPGLGPLAGLVAGLKAAQTPWLFMVACDMPHLDPRVIARVVAERGPGIMAVVPESAGGLESCHALYAKAALPAIEAAMAEGERAPHRLFHRIATHIVPKTEIAALDPTFRSLANLNTPDDLKRV
jgi:molybdopterin-guanine dinucleotide biosynthesis protein A